MVFFKCQTLISTSDKSSSKAHQIATVIVILCATMPSIFVRIFHTIFITYCNCGQEVHGRRKIKYLTIVDTGHVYLVNFILFFMILVLR